MKQQMLSWISQFNICCFLDNQQYDLPHHQLECIAAVGVIDVFEPGADFFSSLRLFTSAPNDWIFGHFSYDCKNYVEDLRSENFDGIRFPECFLFVPEILLQLDSNSLTIGVINEDASEVFRQINACTILPAEVPTVKFQPRISHQAYVETVEKLRSHILRGDCYEVNFCQEFYATAAVEFPSLYKKLQEISPSPFSAFYRINDAYLACSSPERYLQKTGSTIISQPIKGTIKRGLDEDADLANIQALQTSKKEQAENIMIVDLVRNDLSKICADGSVKVDELMGIHSFPQVHQMISTISGTIKSNLNIAEVIHATFPMGSMTGAPKKKVMELIEQYEQTKRGIFSGTVGYINPAGDFDFNVVIRSLMYNAASNYISYQVGSAITYSSDAEQEYEECLVKASGILKLMNGA
jgi:para-aminobenzoate synthetase component I